MTTPNKKQLEKLQAANKPKTPPKTVKPVAKSTKPSVSPLKVMKEVVAKKVPAKEIEETTKSVTTHEEHVDIAKLAYQHLHEPEDKYAKPPTPTTGDIVPLEKVEPSIPVHSVAIAPQGATEPDPYTRSMVATTQPTEPLPVTKEGKLKWSDMKARLPSQR